MILCKVPSTQMDNSYFLTYIAAAICFFMIFRKFRLNQEKKETGSSSFTTSPPSLSTSSVPPPSSSHNWTHDIFPSFCGEDVRRNFLSHIQKEFQRKGITPFTDNEIRRGESIGPELILAIRGSKMAIILISRNYASSKWCLDELVEIMKCREELGQSVMVIFYKVDPSDVKNLTGDFGKVFRKTCVGKTKEDTRRWKEALAKVATIAGYHSNNWDNEAIMIEKIATNISNELINSVPSSDFDNLVGMRSHMEQMEPFLGLDSNEVKMIGIWGPSGIGKSTIARVLLSQHSHQFQLSVFMENIKRRYPRLCSDEYSAKLQLHKEFLSQIFDQEDISIRHLGVAKERLKYKKVFIVLDDVDKLAQLDALAKESRWFGPGSLIIITTQDKKLLNAHGINHIYEVDFPPDDEALQIFCMYAFGQKYTYDDGFGNLAWETTQLAGKLPLGLRVMGSYFKGMPKHEWEEELPRLRTRLDGDIESILKISYDALCDEDQALFLHIACFFNGERIEKVKEYLAENFVGVEGRLRALAEKSFISIASGDIKMHDLLARLGREIVRKQYIHEPGQRQFLVDNGDICHVLRNDTLGSGSVVGIHLMNFELGKELKISDRAFERMSNVQFLRLRCDYRHPSPYVIESLNCLPQNVRLLHWRKFPMTRLPSNFNPEFLVEINMRYSNLEKLWKGNKPIRNLKWMDLRKSRKLKKLPDFSTASNLQELVLSHCSSLVRLPYSIGNAISLEKLCLIRCSSLMELPSSIGNMTSLLNLFLHGCSSLVELPPSIGNMKNLRNLFLNGCSSLVELPSSIGNLHNLQMLYMQSCTKLMVIPININMKSLVFLDLTDCTSLKSFPEISTNISVIKLNGTAIEEIPPSTRSWLRLNRLHMSYCENLKKSQLAFDLITDLHLSDAGIQEISPCVKEMSRLRALIIKGCTKLVSLPELPDSLKILNADNCESLERLDCSFYKKKFNDISFVNCFKLNQEARDLIIKTTTKRWAVFPGETVPTYFTYRATGSSLSMTLNGLDIYFPTSLRFKTCVLLVNKLDVEAWEPVSYCIRDKLSGVKVNSGYSPFMSEFSSPSKEHMFVFGFEEIVSSAELVFEFGTSNEKWEIKECGLRPLANLDPSC